LRPTYAAKTNASNNAIVAKFIIKLNPCESINKAPTSGPDAKPNFETKPAKAAICPNLSNVAHKPSKYGMVKPHAIPVKVLAIK
jgi:hypothetical protein